MQRRPSDVYKNKNIFISLWVLKISVADTKKGHKKTTEKKSVYFLQRQKHTTNNLGFFVLVFVFFDQKDERWKKLDGNRQKWISEKTKWGDVTTKQIWIKPRHVWIRIRERKSSLEVGKKQWRFTICGMFFSGWILFHFDTICFVCSKNWYSCVKVSVKKNEQT